MGLFKKKNGKKTAVGRLFSAPGKGLKAGFKAAKAVVKLNAKIARRFTAPIAKGLTRAAFGESAANVVGGYSDLVYGKNDGNDQAAEALEAVGEVGADFASRVGPPPASGDSGTAARGGDPRDKNGDGKVSFAEGAAAVFSSNGGDLNGDGKTNFGEQVAGWFGGAVRGAAAGAAAGGGEAFLESQTGQSVEQSVVDKYTPHMIAAGFGLVLLLVMARQSK
jgi:hypothetical protein